MDGEVYAAQMDGYKRIALYLRIRQKGLCRLCNQQMGKLSPIVKKHGRPPRYHHVPCAKRLHLP